MLILRLSVTHGHQGGNTQHGLTEQSRAPPTAVACITNMNLFELYLKYSFQFSSWSIQLPQVYGLICLKCRIFFFFYSNLQKEKFCYCDASFKIRDTCSTSGFFFMRNKKNCSDCSSCLKKKAALLICELDWKYVHLKNKQTLISAPN